MGTHAFAAVIVATLLAVPAHADEGWRGKSEVGAVFASGNSETQSGNAKFDTAYERDKWKHAFGVAALVAKDDTGTNAERYEGHFQSDYKLSDENFLFGALRYEDDHYRRRPTPSQRSTWFIPSSEPSSDRKSVV